MSEPAQPKATRPKTKEEVAIEWVLGDIAETVTTLEGIKRRVTDLNGSVQDNARSLERASRDLQAVTASYLERFEELNRDAVKSRLQFSKGFTEYGADLPKRVAWAVFCAAIVAGVLNIMIVWIAWWLFHH